VRFAADAYAVIFVGALARGPPERGSRPRCSPWVLISLPVMMRYGYSKRLAAASSRLGALAQIIPPSLC